MTSRDKKSSRVNGGTAWVKVVSASVGSTITALAVTPLEVVKVRQQTSPSFHTPPPARKPPSLSIVSPCPRGCGTFVLNTGLGEYLTPRNKCGYFDPATGVLKQKKEIVESRGTISVLRKIFANEGLAGIYAGLAPTLVMGIPNTVLYFYAYDELSARLRKGNPDDPSIPAIAGASARFMASLSTAPMELLRTRQAARIGAAQGPYAEGAGMMSEFRTMVRTEGVSLLFRGVWPTLLRDVPFSAVYWLFIERMRDIWRSHRKHDTVAPSTLEQAGQALINGSVSGMIAAAVTTPLDVLKTRIQVMAPELIQAASTSAAESSSVSVQVGESAVCDHAGALVYEKPVVGPATSGTGNTAAKPQSIVAMARTVVETEGVSGLWRGNTARMLKVAPACGIMIASYEIGKRLLDDDF